MNFTTVIFKPRLFNSHATSHKADWILTTRCLLCLALLQSNTNSLTNVIDIEGSCFRLLENYIVITLLPVQSAHIVVSSFAFLSIPFSLILGVIKNNRYFRELRMFDFRIYFSVMLVRISVIYVWWQYQPFWIVCLFLTDKKVNRVLVCLFDLFTIQLKWIKETLLSFV